MNTDTQLQYIIKVKWFRYSPGVAQRVGRVVALLFHDRGTRKGWVASSTPRPHFTPGEDLVPILQEAGWAPGPVWTGGKSPPHRNSIPDRPARSSVVIPTELPGPLVIHNNYWYSTATMITRTRLKVTFYLHCLSCFLYSIGWFYNRNGVCLAR